MLLFCVLQEVDYSDNVISMVQDVMLQKNVPDPRDLRQYDLLGAFGMINYRTLQAACIMQTMADAEALLFLDKNFEEMFNRMPADEVASRLKKELSRMSQQVGGRGIGVFGGGREGVQGLWGWRKGVRVLREQGGAVEGREEVI